jgi:formylglycine-generating enzyme required for sulfatase activity
MIPSIFAACVTLLASGQEAAPSRVARLIADLEKAVAGYAELLVPSPYLDDEERTLLADRGQRIVELDDSKLAADAANWAKAQDGEVTRAVMALGNASQIYEIVRGLQSAGFARPVLLVAPDAEGHMELRRQRILPEPWRTIRDVERPADHDEIVLDGDGERLSGKVLTDSIKITTPYAEKLELPSKIVAAVFHDGESDTYSIATVNGNWIVGSCEDQDLEIEGEDHERETVGIDTVRHLVFGVREHELDGVARNDVILLTSGDILTGCLTDRTLELEAEKVEPDERPGLNPGLTGRPFEREPSSIYRNDDGTFTMQLVVLRAAVRNCPEWASGSFAADPLELRLDLGQSVNIAHTQLARITFQHGYREVAGPPDDTSFIAPTVRVRDWERAATNLIDSLGIELIRVAPASFAMGWPGDDHTEPVHTVKITRPYYLGATEVTQLQWRTLMGDNPSTVKGDELPVTDISWTEAQEFCRRLTERERQAGRLPEDRVYRLPTEAEWELACRAGSGGLFDGKLPDMAWFGGTVFFSKDAVGSVHRVAGRMPNAWGFYDMHGNVYEYCQDVWSVYTADAAVDPRGPPIPEAGEGDDERVLRGGSWSCPVECCTSAARQGTGTNYGNGLVGFRVARVFR